MKAVLRCLIAAVVVAVTFAAAKADPPKAKKVNIGGDAPELAVKDASGKTIKLSELTAKGPVLLRLTCGCSGCDRELEYFQKIHDAYKKNGLTCLFVFREPDAKVATYAKTKKLNMLYAVDTKGQSFKIFQTKIMPTNFLIGKGGKIIAIAAGCDPSGFVANKVSEKVAKTVGTEAVNVKTNRKVIEKKQK